MTRLRIIAVGTRMPEWVQSGFEEYRKRLPREFTVELREIPLARRTRNVDAGRAIGEEGTAMLAALTDTEHVVALEVEGKAFATADIAEQMRRWRGDGTHVAFLIGGPDGLAAVCAARARERWSLSRLTLPHTLVRIVLIEQLYRAWSILGAHPYHR